MNRTDEYIARIRAIHDAEGRDGAAWEARERRRIAEQRPRWEEACKESWAAWAAREAEGKGAQ